MPAMPPVIAWIAHQGGSSPPPVNPEFVTAGNWFVVMHLALFLFLTTFFVMVGRSIWRRTVRPEPHVRLLMELEEEAAPAPTTPAASPSAPPDEPAQPWEKPADWWKK